MHDKLKIGLVGFFGWGNFGDELFVEAHRQKLGHFCELEPVNDLTARPYFTEPIDEVVERYDGFLIGGGDLIVPWALSGLYWKSEFLRKPVFISGVGVPTWRAGEPKVIEAYQRFFTADSVKYISARDAESRDWITDKLEISSHVHWHPDLVCAMDHPISANRQTEDKIFGVVLRHRAKGNDEFEEVRELCKQAKRLDYSAEHIVLGTKEVGERDRAVAENFAEEDEPIRVSDDIFELCEFIGRCSMMASMKFHGTVVATMQGIPSITLSMTNKNRNFLKIIERPDLGGPFNRKDLMFRVPKYPAPIPTIMRDDLRRRASEGYAELESAIRRTFNLPPMHES